MKGQLTYFTPGSLAALPTDPATLRTYITDPRHRQTEPTTTAIIDVVYGILAGNIAPPDVRAAAIRVLEHSGDQVTIGPATRDPLGRTGIELRITGPNAIATTLMIDPVSSQLLAQQLTRATGALASTTTYSTPDIVGAVPADVVNNVAANPQSGSAASSGEPTPSAS